MDFWQDLQGAVDFVHQAYPGLPLALVGYSFGCALLPYVQTLDVPTALILIAPTVAKHDYSTFLSVKTPMLVIASEDDFATDTYELDTWFGSLSMPRELVRQRCDNHFFRGHEDWLIGVVWQFLKNAWR
jgi:alpha/beta superfamily hydrolase